MNVLRPVVVSLLAAALFTLHRCSDQAGATRKNDLDVVGARLRAIGRYRDSFIARKAASRAAARCGVGRCGRRGAHPARRRG
ncbi:hypothetical protein VDR89_16490, partial [Xanthomonas campestris pv. campestris]|nr:hypothetical protein [Xanthomonas campestris pv. campestris]